MKISAFILSALIFTGAGSVAQAQATSKTVVIDSRDSAARNMKRVSSLRPLPRTHRPGVKDWRWP